MVWWRIRGQGLLGVWIVAVLLLCLESVPCLAAETVQRAQVVASYPHDPAAFTQGLVFAGGLLYEGTGLYGESSLRRVRLADGEVLQQVDLESRFFGEGIALLRGRIFQLTWREGTGFIYDLESLEKIGEFTYPGEGWGLTTDGTYLIMSDGSSLLRFLDPETLEPVGTLQVRSSRGEVTLLNELEYINGEIWANIWLSSVICRIDPQSGQGLGWIDLQQLSAAEREGNPGADVLNGIAWDAEAERIFVTGKLWSRVYEIRLVPAD
ncbi:MAG TPA: glutamine cyclotransferase [Firmicutes bacterium]|nr:glutamine cyclotransferase [Bacillota bacterium]